jgi:hypothetical protein
VYFGQSREPVPEGFGTEEFVLRPITVDDAEKDYAAVMETRETLRLWRQSTWPEDDFTVEENREDLLSMVERRAARRAFDYTVVDPEDASCLGCVYVFPPGAKFLAESTVIPLSGRRWADVDAAVLFWVRLSAMASGMDARLLSALREWFAGDWGFERTVYLTSESLVQQVELLRDTDLEPAFELLEPGGSGKRLAFG